MPSNSVEKKSWYSITMTAGEDPEILIYDYIGDYGVSAKMFNDDLVKLKGVKNLILRVNSPGGDVFTGNAIINMLERWSAKNRATITAYVDGLAASMASAVIMVADTVIMPANALIMIHDPRSIMAGTAKEFREWADTLDKIASNLVRLYANKSGKSEDDIRALMAATTWYDAEEAVEEGFADEVEAARQIAAVYDIARYQNAPANYGGDPVDGVVDIQDEESDVTTQNQKAETPAEMEARIRKEVTAELEAKATADKKAADDAAAKKAAANTTAEAPKLDAKEVAAACKLAGYPEMTTAMLDKANMSEVLAALDAKKTEDDAAQTRRGPQARVGADGKPVTTDDDPKAEAIDTNAIYAKFNRRAA